MRNELRTDVRSNGNQCGVNKDSMRNQLCTHEKSIRNQYEKSMSEENNVYTNVRCRPKIDFSQDRD